MGVAKAMPNFGNAPDRHHDLAVRTILAIAGALFSLAGLTLALGSYWLGFDSAAFYILIGLGLVVSGALVARRHVAGAWTYMVVFAATVGLALHNIEAGAALATRLVGPTALLAMIAVLMPVLCRWTPRRSAMAFALIAAMTIGLGLLSQPHRPLAPHAAAATHFLDVPTKGTMQ